MFLSFLAGTPKLKVALRRLVNTWGRVRTVVAKQSRIGSHGLLFTEEKVEKDGMGFVLFVWGISD